MKKKDVELVKGSIGKWLEIKRSTKGSERGPKDCSLCIEYHENDCEGCVVKEHTGKIFCDGTPFPRWWVHQKDEHGARIGSSNHRHINCDECTKLANEMLGFLVGLLPVKEIRKILY
ncbi:MAG: hypothetical protein KAR40_09760 [Candidatus Sabulitectum sp.]|nr:hypothetical protein [Candidatus Sabulitectum sp.]